jgi:hypothetical protein
LTDRLPSKGPIQYFPYARPKICPSFGFPTNESVLRQQFQSSKFRGFASSAPRAKGKGYSTRLPFGAYGFLLPPRIESLIGTPNRLNVSRSPLVRKRL